MQYTFNGIKPQVEAEVFIAPSAAVVGEVTLETGVTVWFGAVIRGDEAPILVGRNSNIQDNAVLHCDRDIPLKIGENVTVGHSVILHSCEIGNNVMIGMGAVVLSGAKIGDGAVVAAGAVVKERDIVAPGSLVAGMPAVFKKQLGEATEKHIIANCQEYIELGQRYKDMEVIS